jgi:hypothetical protein
MVKRAVPSDGCCPAAKAVAVTAETGKVAGNLQPGLRGDVLGVLSNKSP